MESDDFYDDFDDILQSDDDIPKKPQIININKTDNVDKVDINSKTLANKENKSVNNKLFDDDIDHLSLMDSVKSKEIPKKPVKSVLDSLLNPASDLNNTSISFDKLFSKSNNLINSEFDTPEAKTSKPLLQSVNRPSTGNSKSREVVPTPSNKRTVRFSNEPLIDDEFDFDTSHNRPLTAPTDNTMELSKPKFFSRFEAAEFDEVPIKSNSTFTTSSSLESSLWKDSKSDEFTNISGLGLKQKSETNDNKGKDSNRSFPQQKLTEFMQSTQEELLSLPNEKPRQSILNEILPIRSAGSSRKNSIEDLLDPRPRPSVDLIDDLDVGRRLSMSKEIHNERPKTAYSRHDRIQSNFSGNFPSDISLNENVDYQLKIKHLEAERDDLLFKLDKMKQRNMEELEMNENSYKNRIEILEENIQSKEKRLREEIDMLSEQNRQKLQMLEQERLEMRAELVRRQDEIENQKRQEISKIREQHKLEMDKLRLQHEDLIGKIHQAKSEEDTTLRYAQPTTVQLQTVLNQVSNGAQDLVVIKQQLMEQLNHQIKDKDAELKEKNDYLRQLEEKLNQQKDENMRERERLQSLISKLDIQLKDQAKVAEEERWFLRQEQNKLSALQSSLDKEREQILIEKDQNRLSHEEFRKRLLDEQKQMLDQMYEEKRSMAEERAKLTREMCKWSETNQLANIKRSQEIAEMDGMRSALSEERREIEKVKAQMNIDREELLLKTSKIDTLSYDLRMKTEKLNILEKELNAKQSIINDKEQHYLNMEARGEEALNTAKDMHSSHQDQIVKIQKQLSVLNEKEQQINKQLIELEKHRTELNLKEKSIKCSKCSGSLKTNSLGSSYNNLNKQSMNGLGRSQNDLQINPRFNTTMDHDHVKSSLEYSNFVVSQLEEERLIHSIKLAADNDREFLDQERAYLNSLVSRSQSSWNAHVRG